MPISSIFQSWGQKIKQNPTGWGTLLLFAGGLIVLLTLISNMPYASANT